MAASTHQHSFIRLGAVACIDRTLLDFGVDPEPLLAGHGLSLDMLLDGDQLVTAAQVGALLESAVVATSRPHFPLDLAARQDVSLLGSIGLLVQTADTVRQALRDVEQYLRTTHASNIFWALGRRGKFDSFEVTSDLPGISPRQGSLIRELAVAQCFRILRSVSRGGIGIERVSFRHGDAQNFLLVRRFFNVPVEVTGEFDGLLFAPGAIEAPIEHADAGMHESVRRLILAHNTALTEATLAEQVKVLIRSLLGTGQCRIERIARCFACDKRTLQRYLRDEAGTTYQALLDETRFEAACHYLRETALPITQVAQLAGFAEATNFSRSFRQHSGMTPRQWRRRQAIPAPSRLAGRAAR